MFFCFASLWTICMVEGIRGLHGGGWWELPGTMWCCRIALSAILVFFTVVSVLAKMVCTLCLFLSFLLQHSLPYLSFFLSCNSAVYTMSLFSSLAAVQFTSLCLFLSFCCKMSDFHNLVLAALLYDTCASVKSL